MLARNLRPCLDKNDKHGGNIIGTLTSTPGALGDGHAIVTAIRESAS